MSSDELKCKCFLKCTDGHLLCSGCRELVEVIKRASFNCGHLFISSYLSMSTFSIFLSSPSLFHQEFYIGLYSLLLTRVARSAVASLEEGIQHLRKSPKSSTGASLFVCSVFCICVHGSISITISNFGTTIAAGRRIKQIKQKSQPRKLRNK